MRLPTRKPGKYTGLQPDPHITQEKYRELERRLRQLEKTSRPRAIAEVKRLATDGDFSDNAAYSLAKGRLRGINRRVTEIEEQLKKAVIIEPAAGHGAVSLGSRVTVGVNGRIKTYHLLGSAETDPAGGVISRNSPLGAALLGRRTGAKIKIQARDKETEYKIIKIE